MAAAAAAAACVLVTLGPATPAAAYHKTGEAKGVDTLGLFGSAGAQIDVDFEIFADYEFDVNYGHDVFAGSIMFDHGAFGHSLAGYDTAGGALNPTPQITLEAGGETARISDLAFNLLVYNTENPDIGYYDVFESVSGLGEQLELFSPTGSAPEPSTWALLSAGFGLAGLALRLRKRLSVVAA